MSFMPIQFTRVPVPELLILPSPMAHLVTLMQIYGYQEDKLLDWIYLLLAPTPQDPADNVWTPTSLIEHNQRWQERSGECPERPFRSRSVPGAWNRPGFPAMETGPDGCEETERVFAAGCYECGHGASHNSDFRYGICSPLTNSN